MAACETYPMKARLAIRKSIKLPNHRDRRLLSVATIIQMATSMDRLTQVEARLLGTVMNFVPTGRRGYGDKYGYGCGCGGTRRTNADAHGTRRTPEESPSRFAQIRCEFNVDVPGANSQGRQAWAHL